MDNFPLCKRQVNGWVKTGIPVTCKWDDLPCQTVCLLPAFPSSFPVAGMLPRPFLLLFPLPFHLCLPQPASAPTRRCPPGVLSCSQRKLSARVGSSTAVVWLSWRLLTVRYISANCKHPRQMSSAAQVPPRMNEEVLAL